MMRTNLSQPETEALRAVIQVFLQERLQPKLEKLKEGEVDQHQKLIDAHQPETWIADAARRVSQIQQVTHALKFTHPDAKGTNLSVPGNSDADELTVGTHTTGGVLTPDVVGNAAALDVNKFLRLEVEGKTILARASEGDLALQEAFSTNPEQAKSWMTAFSGITESKGGPVSHKFAKQLYWPVGNNEYHLLSPLFPTALVHTVWHTIREDRFSEGAKAAREAKRADIPHAHGYREYLNIVVQQFGGTKPQNISQLNSERYGENYLLPSCPPNWQSDPIKPPLRINSVFDGWFSRRKPVRELTRILREYLASVQSVNNIYIREKRADLVGCVCDELLQFAAELHELPPGWSQHQDCRLNMDEQCWLDPWRAEIDETFASVRARGEWQDGICKRFANWLNARLTDSRNPLPFGEAEALEWQSTLDKELRMIRMEIDSND